MMTRYAKSISILLGSLMMPTVLNAQASDKPSDQEMDAISRAKALAEAQTAMANAQKAAADAEAARIASEVAAAKAAAGGGVEAASPPTGNNTYNTGTGKAEATLLYGKALRNVSDQLNRDICSNSKGLVYVVTSASPNFDMGDLAAFQIARFATLHELDDAQNVVLAAIARASRVDPGDDEAEGENARIGLAGGLAAANSLAGALAKVGSYFKSVYTTGEITLTANDEMLAALVTCQGEAMPSLVRPGAMPVLNIDEFIGGSGQSEVSLHTVTFGLDSLRARSLQAAAMADSLASAESDEAKNAVSDLRGAVAYGNATIAKAQGFLDSLTATSANTPVPKIVAIARQQKLKTTLADPNTRLLILNQIPLGAYYTRDNLWTFLGGPPVHVMGGVALSYSVVDPNNGTVSKSGVFVEHGGYQRLSAVEKVIKKSKTK